ncbi:MAG TPA: hypothetical protein DCX25_01765 [Candidatus Pacebacteria bacterium]|nr:MAG: hypothetical protein UX00_C0002G0019 [Microgenomates group bacterium GW2011_GWB1_45_17]KKU23095.1 MAG: hypothetical protein UX35_C0010G0013 [Microgenomates group bacterium GW2011_GWA1_46_15]KKU23758.1 MAG: hypothetical protein UX36_C0003G0058 [Microgenomates group bacterium GW2011_GWC1_46_15]HAV15032.1 hypothetical protein [Candidatus Paceibacterota bacterium]
MGLTRVLVARLVGKMLLPINLLILITPTEITIDPRHPKFTQLVRRENLGRVCILHEGRAYGIVVINVLPDGKYILHIHEVHLPENCSISMNLIQL